MPEHSSIQLIRTLDSLRSALEPLSAVQRAINSDQSIRLALSAANRSQAALRTMLGPVEESPSKRALRRCRPARLRT